MRQVGESLCDHLTCGNSDPLHPYHDLEKGVGGRYFRKADGRIGTRLPDAKRGVTPPPPQVRVSPGAAATARRPRGPPPDGMSARREPPRHTPGAPRPPPNGGASGSRRPRPFCVSMLRYWSGYGQRGADRAGAIGGVGKLDAGNCASVGDVPRRLLLSRGKAVLLEAELPLS